MGIASVRLALTLRASETEGSLMSRLARNRWLLLACVVVFSLGGFAMVLEGDANAQVAGWTCLLFFGVGGGSAVAGQFVAGHPAPLERQRVRLPDGTQATAMVLAYPRYPSILRTMAGVGLVAACAVFALAPRAADGGRFDGPGTRAIMGLAAVYLAVATVLRLSRRSPGPDTIALTARALLVSAAGAVRYVPWTSVRSVNRRDLFGNPTLTVVAQSPDAIIRSGVSDCSTPSGPSSSGRVRLQSH